MGQYSEGAGEEPLLSREWAAIELADCMRRPKHDLQYHRIATACSESYVLGLARN